MSKVKQYENLGVILDDFDIWSGQVSLQENDLLFEGDLPSGNVINLGTKRLIDRSYLRPFHRLKAACRRYLLSYGMKFLNGVAVPIKEIDEIQKTLKSFEEDFEREKTHFLNHYDDYCDEWIQHNSNFKDQIKSARLTKEEVEKRLNFDYQIFLIQAANEAQAEKLEQKTKELGHDLLDEVVDVAQHLLSTHFVGRKRVGRRVHNTLHELTKKVQGLTFLHGDLIPLLKVLNEALNMFSSGMSQGEYIEGREFRILESLILDISSRERIEALHQRHQNSDDSIDSTSHDFDSFYESSESELEIELESEFGSNSLYF